jgi:SAM-dependent methyltransferase
MAAELDLPPRERPSRTRLGRERAFHNRRYAAGAPDPRGEVRKLYRALRGVHDAQAHLLRTLGTGKAVLEYGCADGTLSLDELGVPRFVASLDGIDISDGAIAVARDKATRAGLLNVTFQHMDGEAMGFPDASFDVVYGRGILHHLDLAKALAEIARVLRPNGTALFVEPLGHNPLINWYRRRTPALRTPDEHPLVRRDLIAARRHFRTVDSLMAGLAAPLGALLARRFDGAPAVARLLGACEALDRVLLRLPGLKWQAWHTCLILRK